MSWWWWACEVIRAPGVGLIVWTLTHAVKSDWAGEAKQNKLKKKEKSGELLFIILLETKFWPDERGRRLRASNQPVLYKYSRKSRSANVG